jgi:hypothetical protein
VAGLLTAAAVLITWPLAGHLGSGVTDLGDPLLHSWVLAWDLHALGTAPGHLFDANIFHPRRWTLAFADHLVGLLPLAAPVGLAGGGPILLHNAVLFATFPLTGLTMFWLVRALTGQAGAGVVAGALYAFSHYRLSQLGHVQVLSHQWLPLIFLGLHRTVAGGARWRDLALVGLAVALQALSSGYNAALGAVAVAVFLIWALAPAGRPRAGRLVRRGLLAGALTAVALLPFFLPYAVVRRDFGLARGLTEVESYAARPEAYLTPARSLRWLPVEATPRAGTEGTVFPGVLVLALAAGGLLAGLGGAGGHPPLPRPPGRRWPAWLDPPLAAYVLFTLADVAVLGGAGLRLGPLRLSHRSLVPGCIAVAALLLVRRLLHGAPASLPGLGWLRRLGWPHAAGLYLLLTVVAVLCSFGPTLRLGPLPDLWPLYRRLYDWVPGFDGLRVPARFAILTATGLAVLAGYGVAALLARIESSARRAGLVAVLVALALIEVETIPLSLADVEAVDPVDRWLATAPRGPVAILPFYPESEAYMEATRQLGSTAHWQPLVNGYSGFEPPGYRATVEELSRFPAPAAVARLRALGVRHVVVRLDQLRGPERERIDAALAALPAGVSRVADVDQTVILEVTGTP